MSKKALLLSDNSVLADVYSANLLAYVDVEVTTVASLSDYEKALESSKWDIVLSVSKIAADDVAKEAYSKLAELSEVPPFAVIGAKSSVSNQDGLITLAGNLDVKSLVRTIAGVFKIGAKEMAALEVPDYYPIPIKLFQYLERGPCNVFVQTSKNQKKPEYALAWEKGAIRRHVVTEYVERGFDVLYVAASDRLKVINLVSQMVISTLDDPNLSNKQRLDVLEQGFEVVAAKLTDDAKVTTEVVAISKKCIEQITDVIKSFPKLRSLLLGLAENKSRYLYFHSILSTYISNHIVRHISWGGEGHAEKISFVLYFHDIFLVPIYNKYPQFKFEEELVFNNLLSDREKEVVVGHARMAGELVKTFPRAPMGADVIVTQHHGLTSGNGFTMDFKDDVSPLAKVIIIAEALVDEIIRAKDAGKAPDKTEMLAELRVKFPRHTYKKIIDTLENLQL